MKREPKPSTRSSSPLLSCGSVSSGSPSVIDSSIAGVLGAEVGDRERHQRRAGRLEGGHPQAPAAQAGDRLELRLGLGQAAEHGVGVAHERLARLRQAHAARAALHEDRAGLALERGDLLRDGGLGEGEGLRGGGEGALDGDLSEDAHAADVEHELSL